MSWNRPSEQKKAVGKKDGQLHVRLLLGIVCLVLATAGAWLFLSDSGGKGETDQTAAKSRFIKGVAAEGNKSKPSATIEANPSKKWKTDRKTDKTSALQPPEVSARLLEIRKANIRFFGKPIFQHTSENELFGVLNATPGERFVVDHAAPNFDEDFKSALKEKIEIYPDDPDDIKEAKNAMIAARKMLGDYLAKGESPAAVVTDMIQDLNKIADYKEKHQSNIQLLIKEGKALDVEDYLAEANQMLKDYGASPLTVHPKILQKMRERENAEGEIK